MSCWPYTTRRWERLRRLKLQTNPLCEACLQEGEITPAEVVDHRIPISERGRKERLVAEAFLPLDQLASLCASHHNTKTRAEQLGQTDWMRAGCDIFGRPNDPDHPWNRDGKRREPPWSG
jgi:5-methylcytosine-specific restriction endonuclease McrA